MADRRGTRFLVEVLFLVALAAALAFARLDPLEIAGIMLVGWVIVAALEWAAWRGEPHFGSGLPPRYYVPTVNLPPAQPLEQVAMDGYPDASRDEAPTWIAPAALRAEMLGEWPVAVRVPDEPQPDPEPAPEPEPEPEPELEPGAAAVPHPWTVTELPAAPLGELHHELLLPEPEAQPEPEPTIDVVLTRSAQGRARYSLDPLADPAPRRRFGRGGGAAPVPVVEVAARPEGVRVLPGRTNGQD